METENTKSQIETIEKLTAIAEKKPMIAASMAFSGVASTLIALHILHLSLATLPGAAILVCIFVVTYIFVYGTLHVINAVLQGIGWVLKSLFHWVLSPITTEKKLQKELAERKSREKMERDAVINAIRALPNRSKLIMFVWLKQDSQTIQVPMNDRDPWVFVNSDLMDEIDCPVPVHKAFRFKQNVWNVLQSMKSELLNNREIMADIEAYETQVAPMKSMFPWM